MHKDLDSVSVNYFSVPLSYGICFPAEILSVNIVKKYSLSCDRPVFVLENIHKATNKQ